MTRGERDYTQRVLATIRPGGMIGGRLIFLEDFENLISIKGDTSGGTLTSTLGEVWDGDYALKLSSTYATGPRAFTAYFPNPSSGILSAEILFKALDTHMGYMSVGFSIYDGTYYYGADVYIDDNESVLRMRIRDSTNTIKTVRTFKGTGCDARWHILHISINLPKLRYEVVQYDGNRINLQTEPVYSQTVTDTPQANAHAYILAKSGTTCDVSIDNFLVTYEDL